MSQHFIEQDVSNYVSSSSRAAAHTQALARTHARFVAHTRAERMQRSDGSPEVEGHTSIDNIEERIHTCDFRFGK